MQNVFRIGIDPSRRRALELDLLDAISLGGTRESFDDFLHYGPAGERVLAVDIGAQLLGCLAHDRLGNESVARLGHAVHSGDRFHDLLEHMGVERHRGHAVFAIERDCVHGDRRRAGASMADADDGAIAVGFDRLPGFRIVFRVDARHLDELGLHRWHMLGEPVLHLAQKKSGVVEARIDEINRLAVEAPQPRRHRLRRNL